ncbi:MAG: hypothetical protein J7L15_03120 [Clostridiales bacterium]|nr:hypothetical protein [Clostridiales bacterium]
MELAYEDLLYTIKIRKNMIVDAALESDDLNNEFMRLTEMETSIRNILRKSHKNLTHSKGWSRDNLPRPSEQNALQKEV